MKAIITVTQDGIRNLVSVEGDEFDTRAWAESRKASFQLLGVVKVVEHPLPLSRPARVGSATHFNPVGSPAVGL
jgi:hypothetical protein